MAPTAPHILVVRRQEVQVITQTVALPSTTYTTHVTLGVPSATDRPDATSHHSNPNGLTDTQIGVIAGTVVGVFLLVLIVLCFCCRARRPREVTIVRPDRKRSSYGGSSFGGSADRFPEPSPSRERWSGPVPVPPPMGHWDRPMPMPMPMNMPMPMPEPSPKKKWKKPRPPPREQVWPSAENGWTRPIPVPHHNPVQFPPPSAQQERIPGGPKYPTYRALPIPNPRRPTPIRRAL